MKDQYVGDVNDYVKYGFLQALSAARAGPLVVCWMLTPSDEGPDGGKVGYLGQPERYRGGDTELFDTLRNLVRAGRRSVEAVEQAGVLPGASFLSPVVSDRADQRRELFEQLQRQAPEDALVFFDPDNGFEVKSKPRGRRDSSKYVFWDEIEATAQPGRSVVIYQHYSRTPRDLMVSGLIAELERRLQGHRAFALRGPHVAYLVAARGMKRHALRRPPLRSPDAGPADSPRSRTVSPQIRLDLADRRSAPGRGNSSTRAGRQSIPLRSSPLSAPRKRSARLLGVTAVAQTIGLGSSPRSPLVRSCSRARHCRHDRLHGGVAELLPRAVDRARAGE